MSTTKLCESTTLLLRHPAIHVGPEFEYALYVYEQLLRNEEFQKGQREVLLRQLTRRFGALPDAIASRLADAGRSELERWSDRIFDAASLDDVFASP
jgi:hypothetical protein